MNAEEARNYQDAGLEELPPDQRAGAGYHKRRANFELLRVLAMLMVVALHYLSHGNLLPVRGEALTAATVTGTVAEALCIAAVNVWILISGYFLSDTGVSLKKLLRVVAEIYFYTILITLVMELTGQGSVLAGGAYGVVEYLFPISGKHYWFATAYVFMYLFSPLLNKGVLVLTRKQLKVAILGLLIWFCFIKSLVPVYFATDDYGYGFGWFMTLYLIAAYIRRYKAGPHTAGHQEKERIPFLNTPRGCVLLWLGSVAGIILVRLVIHAINLKTGHLASWQGTPFDYNYILTLTAALGLFGAFRFLRIREGLMAEVLRVMGPLTFGVYLLHEHLLIRDQWIDWVQDFIGEIPRENPLFLVIHMITSVIIVFLAGIMIDFIRVNVFRWLARVLGNTKPVLALKKLDKATHKDNGRYEKVV